jgi:hypothetical protein
VTDDGLTFKRVSTYLIVWLEVLLVAISALGFWRGWFEVGGKKDDEKAHADLDVNVNKLKADKDAFKKLLGEKSSAMKDKIASLRNKAKELSGEAKASVEKEINSLTKRRETIVKKMGEVEDSTEEKFKELRNSLKGEIEEEKGAEREKTDAPTTPGCSRWPS